MAAQKLKIEQVAPKEWKFADPPGLAGSEGEFSIALELLEEERDTEAEKKLREVLAACPLHIDAYHHLALIMCRRGDLAAAYDLWTKAVEIGTSSLPEGFVPDGNRLEWGWIENRPFLRACHGLGLFFFDNGRVEAAHVIFNQVLAMNPSDNQGIRALAIESGFAMDRPDEVLRICDEYKGDGMADTLYGRPLALLQTGRKAQAEKALIRAVALFPQVARELLKKRHRMPKAASFDSILVGGEEEAYEYWQRLGKYWQDTEGALAFLADVLARCQEKVSTAKH